MGRKNGRSTSKDKKTAIVKRSKNVNKKVSKKKIKKKYDKEDVKVTIKLVLSLVTIVVCSLYIIGVYEDKSLLDSLGIRHYVDVLPTPKGGGFCFIGNSLFPVGNYGLTLPPQGTTTCP